MDTSARWAEITGELHQQRLRWATETYDRFLADLAPAIRRELPSARPRVTASLYGETQVGKTTLLLTLLGVDPGQLEQIGDTLRADRPAGMSATATATRYRAAPGDHWTWTAGPDDEAHRLTGAELRARIAEVRVEVEGGRWPLDRVVEIGLPTSCFTDTGATAIEVLDLPGVNAVNAQEDRHARFLLDRWITASDVVILVALVNHLPPLRPATLGVEALRHWPRQLGKFRVVLTYAYSDLVTKQWLATTRPDVRTISALRTEIRADFDPANWPGLERSELSWIYPLEFGESWSTLVGDDPAHPANALREEALRLLRADLTQAVRPVNRLRRAFEARDVAESVRASRTDEWDRAVRAADLDVERQQRRRHRLLRILERFAADLADLAEARRTVQAVRPGEFEPPPLDTGSKGDPLTVAKAEWALTDAFREHWSRWRTREHVLRNALPTTILTTATAPGRDDVSGQIGPIVEEHFAPIRGRAASVRARLSAAFRRRTLEETLGAYEQAAVRIGAAFTKSARERIADVQREIDEATAAYETRARRVETALVATEQAIVTGTEAAGRVRDRRRVELDAMTEHVEVAAEFPARLELRYQERRAELLRAVAAATDPLSALAASLAVVDCARAYDMIRDTRRTKQVTLRDSR